jgi:hypothetical protein
MDLARAEDRARIQTIVLEEYRRNYRGLGMDGIYFQTLTEHHNTGAGGLSTAAAARELVNATAGALLTDEPDLYIQFGLHAISVGDCYADLAALDPRVTIVWEDAGLIPFSYNPVTEADKVGGQDTPDNVRTVEQTLAYAKRLATFRPGTEFAMVPKGWITLRWDTEFEHHGPFILGRRDPTYIEQRLAARQGRWDEVNALWRRNFPLAVNFYREILACKPARTTVTGLIEDGMLEEAIQPSVALFAQTIWNPHAEPEQILHKAESPTNTR